ncbi:TPA: protein YpfM, partial [Escherichia coli]|nr:protein YpfM [Escherichia coli]HCP3062910.1 protein YpfM [Escherichia coli]HDS9806763.1 protein YpfM [Escherichia coli]
MIERELGNWKDF